MKFLQLWVCFLRFHNGWEVDLMGLVMMDGIGLNLRWGIRSRNLDECLWRTERCSAGDGSAEECVCQMVEPGHVMVIIFVTPTDMINDLDVSASYGSLHQ